VRALVALLVVFSLGMMKVCRASDVELMVSLLCDKYRDVQLMVDESDELWMLWVGNLGVGGISCFGASREMNVVAVIIR
jgi:hypothetical protein